MLLVDMILSDSHYLSLTTTAPSSGAQCGISQTPHRFTIYASIGTSSKSVRLVCLGVDWC